MGTINLSYGGQTFANFDEPGLLEAGVPQENIDAAKLAGARAAMRCTPRQARLALAAEGLLDDVTAWIATQDQATQLTWEYATEILRTDPIIIVAGTALSLTDEALDDLFGAAAQL